jgi:dCMP deaminase
MNTIELMKHASLLCDKSTCGYKIGCLAVRDGGILLEGFNEQLAGEMYCQNGTCSRQELGLTKGKDPHIVCAIHAEASVIAQAASKGISLEGCDIYVTTFPCLICARSLVKVGIGHLYYMTDYTDGNQARSLLEANGIEIVNVSKKDTWGED